MAFLDKQFVREARKVMDRAPKKYPGLAALLGLSEDPICYQSLATVAPGNKYGALLATGQALYATTPNGSREGCPASEKGQPTTITGDAWTRVPWNSI